VAAPPIDFLAPGTAPALALLGTRISGLVLIAPTLSARTIPARHRAALVLLLTALLAPVALLSLKNPARITPESMLAEMVIGFTLGLGAAVIVAGAEAAGESIANQIGLSGAAILDPLNNTSVPALGQFMQLIAVTLLLVSDLHLVLLDALVASTRVAPLGEPIALVGGLRVAADTASTLFALGLRLAAPVMAVVLIGNVALAVLGRAAPQLQVLAVAFPLQIGLGLLALAASLPFVLTWFTGWAGTYDALSNRIMSAFLAGG